MAFGNTTSDNEMKRNFEISDRDGQDSTQDSLTEEAKSLLNTHKLTQVFSSDVRFLIIFFSEICFSGRYFSERKDATGMSN